MYQYTVENVIISYQMIGISHQMIGNNLLNLNKKIFLKIWHLFSRNKNFFSFDTYYQKNNFFRTFFTPPTCIWCAAVGPGSPCSWTRWTVRPTPLGPPSTPQCQICAPPARPTPRWACRTLWWWNVIDLLIDWFIQYSTKQTQTALWKCSLQKAKNATPIKQKISKFFTCYLQKFRK